MRAIKSILIVEDLVEVAQWMRHQVETLLVAERIDEACNLATARECIAARRHDLLLVDLGLPDGEGADLIKPFKSRNPQAQSVVTTIFDDAEHLFRALRCGADGYLLKDDTEEEFQAQLAGILDGRPPLSSSIARRLLQQFHPVSGEQDAPLTQRERDLLTLIAKGLSVRCSAEKLGISPHTAAGYMKDIYYKLQVNTRAEATLKAINLGLVNPV